MDPKAILVSTASILGIAVPSLLWLRSRLAYSVSKRHLDIQLFGLPIRRIRLHDIERVSKRRRRWTENWSNTWKPSHRQLIIHRRRGWFRQIQITPANRYAFRTELERAIAAVQAPLTEPPSSTGPDQSDR